MVNPSDMTEGQLYAYALKLQPAIEEAERLFRIIVQGPSEAEMWHTGNHIRAWLKNYSASETGSQPAVKEKE